MSQFHLRAGDTRALVMADHELSSTGYATFVVDTLDETKPAQWSVIGARKSELIPEDDNQYSKTCRVWVMPDQYTDEDRIVHVSVVGSEVGSAAPFTETTATLTVQITPKEAMADKGIQFTGPKGDIFMNTKTSALTPAKVVLTATFNDSATAASELLRASVTVDVDGAASRTFTMTPPTASATDKTYTADITNYIKESKFLIDKRDFANVTYTIELKRAVDSSWDVSYSHVRGGNFTVRKKNT